MITLTNGILKKRPILDKSTVLYSNDPLHLMKRGRYRLLSHEIVPLFKYDYILNISLIKELTNLPEIIFDDSSVTKMHDFLPL